MDQSTMTSAAVARPSLHNPQRYEGESFGEYKARRAQSHRSVALILGGNLIDLHKANRTKKDRRDLIARIGRRQYIKQSKQFKRELAEYAARNALAAA